LDKVGEDSRAEEQKEWEHGKESDGRTILGKKDSHGEQQKEDDERDGVAEEAAAARGAPSHKRYKRGDERGWSRVEKEMREDAREQTSGKRLRRKAKPSGMGEASGQGHGIAKIAKIQKNKGKHNSGKEYEQRGTAAMRYGPDHKCSGWKEKPGEEPLGSGGEGDGDTKQNNALPVPENGVARCVESVRGGNGGEDEAEGSPGGKDLRPGKRGARNHCGAKDK